MLIDSHLHLTGGHYPSIDEFVEKSKENNVKILIISCNSIPDIEEGLKYSREYEHVYLTIGFAPHYLETISLENLNLLKEYAKDKKVIGIGEIGLDYYWTDETKKMQMEFFRQQLQLAEYMNLPVVIHTRRAFEDTYEILKEYKVKGIIHCFEGFEEEAQAYIDIGFYLGIGGLVTYKNHLLSSILRKIDVKNLVLETDSPYLSPEPIRREINGSWNIPIIADKLASIYETTPEQIAEITTKNVLELFDLDYHV